MPLNYDEKYRLAYRENIEKIQKNPLSVAKKIRNLCSFHGLDESSVIRQIKENKLAAVLLAKDPQKQNFFEKTAAAFIKGMQGVENFRRLNKKKEAMYISAGNLLEKSQKTGISKAKSIDFAWEYGGRKFYGYHKYTREEGGSQDNQYTDVKGFVEESREYKKADAFFIAIMDGDFYSGKNGESGKTRTQTLKDMAGANSQVLVCDINQLEGQMKKAVRIIEAD